MIRSYPIKLNPTPAQSAGIEYVLSSASLYYNQSCAVRKDEYLTNKKFIPNGELAAHMCQKIYPFGNTYVLHVAPHQIEI